MISRDSIWRGVVVTLALGAALTPQVVHADATPADIAAARSLGIEGLKLAEAGDCKSAVEKLDKAEKLYHAPTVLERWGECQISLGKLVAGTEALQHVATETLPPSASSAFVKAQERARAALKDALPKLAKLKISVKGTEPGAEVEVTVDGEAMSRVLLDADRPTDPGARTVVASAKGYSKDTKTVTLKEGESASVVLTLQRDKEVPPPVASVAPPPPPPPVSTAPPPPQEPPPPPPAKSNVVGFVVLGVGVVGVAAGTIFGLSASSKKSSLDKSCVDKHCPASSQSDIDSMKSAATISTVGFGVGIVGLGVGTYLLLTGGSSAEAPPATGLRVTPYLGPSAAGVRGTF